MESELTETATTDLGFRYIAYIKGTKQRELFLGLRRSYAKKATRKMEVHSAAHQPRGKVAARR